jgi:hypothetical protein
VKLTLGGEETLYDENWIASLIDGQKSEIHQVKPFLDKDQCSRYYVLQTNPSVGVDLLDLKKLSREEIYYQFLLG